MKNRYWIAGLCLLVLMLCLVSACGGGGGATTTSQATTTSAGGGSLSDILGKLGKIDTISYDLTMTVTGQAATTMKIYQKGNKTRLEMTMQGIATVSIVNGDTQTSYVYMPALNMATKMPYSSSQIAPSNWEDATDVLKYNPNIIGTETIDGKSCMVITFNEPGQGSAKEWIWTENGFPLKMEMTSSGVTTTIAYTNVNFSDISDSMFVLPAGVNMVSG
jgi:outer membrane lipoprotein-sorting protein